MTRNRPISPKEKEAWDFAKELHKDQVRKFINKSYFMAHVQKVNGIVKQYTTDEDLLCAALLHDTIEDCFEDKEVGYHIIEEKFGKRVADIVMELTSSKEEIENEYDSKADYLINKMIHMSNDALVVKLADRLQNISDAFTASERFRNNYFQETTKIMDELEKNRRFNRVQGLLASQIKMKLDNIGSIFKIKRFKDFSESYNLLESKESSNLKFNLQTKKKGAKTETYNVSKDGNIIGQIKWSSRMRGYSFLPTNDINDEIKDFVRNLMKKRREEK
jgi:(p)ppGpp synthase/HD superfamily hydrolase